MGRMSLNGRRSYRAAAVLLVAGVHGLLLVQLGRLAPTVSPKMEVRPVVVELWSPVRPADSPPPDSVPEISLSSGGGRPSAPSRVHTPPQVPPKVPELPIAPLTPAPEPEIVVGPSPVPVPHLQTGSGTGQSGSGQGTGQGHGQGAGAGSGSGPRFIRGVGPRRVMRAVPRELRAHIPAQMLINCEIASDSRMRACRVESPDPNIQSIGRYAIPVVEEGFRFAPPTDSAGRPIEGRRVTVTFVFKP